MDNMNIYEESRPWGKFRRFTENRVSTVKIITVLPNMKLSLQSHKKRGEFWKVISGSGIFEINSIKIKAEIDTEQYVPVEAKHRIIAGEQGLTILEITDGEFDENDIVRFEDDFGRV